MKDNEIKSNLEWLKTVVDRVDSITNGKEFISAVLTYINRLEAKIDDMYDTLYYRAYKILELEDNLKTAKAENERLKKGWKADILLTENTKAEAYKEFADKVYEKVGFYITETNDTLNKMILGEKQGTLNRKHYLFGGLSVLYEINSILDNLLKEMVGE